MRKGRRRRWLLTFVFTLLGCRAIEDERGTAVPTLLDTPAISQKLETSTNAPANSPTHAPKPSPVITPTDDPQWQRIGDNNTGLQWVMPLTWQNFSGQVDTTTPFGVTVLFATDTQRTAESLLAGKTIGDGAFAVGILGDMVLPLETPQANLEAFMTTQGLEARGNVQSITAIASSGRLNGAVVDVNRPPLSFIQAEELPTRIYMFPFRLREDGFVQERQAIFMLGANNWQPHEKTLTRIADSFTVYDAQNRFAVEDGSAQVMGELYPFDPANVVLDNGVTDIWSFTSEGARYATLTLSADNDDLDLKMTIISPSGQTIAVIDNGYTGAVETATDIVLTENGRYFVQISEFFAETGWYTLSLVLTDDPLFTQGGAIRYGQSLQSDLSGEDQQVWLFDGTASDLVSIVVMPEDEQLDPILDLYGPDGRRLVALDEGFSGDAEVISNFELPVTGEYTIMVRNFSVTGGTYSLSLDEGGDIIANFYEAGDLFYGQLAIETLQADEAHAWYFTGQPDDEILIKATPLDDIDLEVWLFDPTIERIATQDAYWEGAPETIETTLTSTGNYLILVREFFGQTGQYELQLSASPAREPLIAGMIEAGTAVNQTLAPQQDVIWLFDAQEGDVIDIELIPINTDSDLILAIQDPNGVTTKMIDTGSAGESETLTDYLLMSDGTWGIVIKSFFDEGGKYQLNIISSASD